MFSDDYEKGADVKSYWLSSGGHLTSSRGYLDRAEVNKSTTSYAKFLNYIVADTSTGSGRGRLYCMGKKPVGIAAWADNDAQETGLIPADTINRFLADARNGSYEGFASVGFSTATLLDPTRRKRLKMPEDLKHGVYVTKVYNLGSGSEEIKEGDVILAVDRKVLNAYGRFLHPKFDRIFFHQLITGKSVKDSFSFEIWRDGKKQKLKVKARNFEASEMLVPYYEHKQPEYFVTGGYVFQKMTRAYLSMWGDDWPGKVPSHLYHYYREMSFNPSSERSDIVILSYVLPHDINIGYQGLGRIVVSKFNGKEIADIGGILEAKKLNLDSKFDVIEFEQDYPTVVIPRGDLASIEAMIAQRYGVTKQTNIEP